MTIRLREEEPAVIHYFAKMPRELTCHILTSCNPKNKAPEYLSNIARVCKIWNNLIHDVTVELLNKGVIRLVNIPFIHIKKKTPYEQAFSISRYLTFQRKKLRSLDITDLRYFENWLIDRVKDTLKNIESVVRCQCSIKDNILLPKFTGVKTLNIGPNYNTDLSFIPTLVKLKSLSLHFIGQSIFEKALDTIAKTTTVTTLNLSTSVKPYLEFPEEFYLPAQLKAFSLKGFNFSSEILDKSPLIERLQLTNTHLSKPCSLESLKELKHFKLHIRETITTFEIRDFCLDYFELTAISLKELNLKNCVFKEFKSLCPLLEDKLNDHTVT